MILTTNSITGKYGTKVSFDQKNQTTLGGKRV